MSGKNINFDEKKIKKCDFYKNKKAFQIDNVDVNKVLVSKKERYGTKKALKYFIGYNDNDVIRPLCVTLPQMTGYAKKINGHLTMSFIANNKKLVKNYNKIWEKVKNLMRIDFESELVYSNDKKIEIYAGSMITNFNNKKMPKEKAPCKCLSIIILDSVTKAKKKYNPETLYKKI